MEAWQGKFTIGLTGNIATGKSVIRRMLTHLGAFGIDADYLVHRLLVNGAPGFVPVVSAFGTGILSSDGEIDRSRLGKLVFSDTGKLQHLEGILHPLVDEAIDWLITQIPAKIIVIEAIKLLESGLGAQCDSIWVADTGEGLQLKRLVQNRNMPEQLAGQRMGAQPDRSIKISRADTIIHNEGSLWNLWEQVKGAWNSLIPSSMKQENARFTVAPFSFICLRPDQTEPAFTHLSGFNDSFLLKGKDLLLEAFAENSFYEIYHQADPAGLLVWKNENFIARIEKLILSPAVQTSILIKQLLKSLEALAAELLCELMIIPGIGETASAAESFRESGYLQAAKRLPGNKIWSDAVAGRQDPGTSTWYKPLREVPLLVGASA